MGVYKRGNRWWLDFYLLNGKRMREPVTVKGIPPEKITRQHAERALDIRRGEVASGKFNIAETKKPVLFDKLVRTYLEDYSEINKKSWKRDRTSCRALMGYFGDMKLSQITPWAVDKYKSSRLKVISRLNKPISKANINREIACLKKMLFYAVGEGWLSSNPLKGHKLLYKEVPKKIRVVSPEEFQRVYDEASESLKPILVTAYNTGMRTGEILALKWENVSLTEGYIRVVESKNGESRYIPINRYLKEALKSVESSTSAGGYVFSHNGGPVRAFKTAFTAAVRRAGVERFTFHDFRHTFASNLVMKGVDLATVQELLGHKSILMTKRYSHPTPEHKKRAVEMLNIDAVVTNPVTVVTEIKNKVNLTS